MPKLTAPTPAVHASFLDAMAEFRAEGRGGPDDGSAVAREIRAYGDRWHDPAVFAAYTAWLREQSGPGRDTGTVPCTHFWCTEGEIYLGRLAVRHRLDDFLREYGGHIGYDVRPSARRRGHATAMLRAALPRARALGLGSVLVTCDHDNLPSRRVIEACGGIFEDRRGAKLRYWIDTADTPGTGG
ncbi:GNAT family N-acetyltransferase [Streptomyces sp. HNM0574]|uniref:GNAT family N-acetyltransferase n=1 Tax=Streptomyces sp. HNM0574 TaxID=2714954 RepID=UPI00146B4822|nr:GNAT family N-acetyltransferase [Streptomyces sp. HNM0574]NLU66369.1 GNAT family N-acetyltransferase [Streptomyces sp. HNM0574]